MKARFEKKDGNVGYIVVIEPGIDGEFPVKVLMVEVGDSPAGACVLFKDRNGWISRCFDGLPQLLQEQHWDNLENATSAVYFYVAVLSSQLRSANPGCFLEIKELPMHPGV